MSTRIFLGVNAAGACRVNKSCVCTLQRKWLWLYSLYRVLRSVDTGRTFHKLAAFCRNSGLSRLVSVTQIDPRSCLSWNNRNSEVKKTKGFFMIKGDSMILFHTLLSGICLRRNFLIPHGSRYTWKVDKIRAESWKERKTVWEIKRL